jgi:adenylate cyclase
LLIRPQLHFFLFRRQHEEALTEAQRAITLDPNDPRGYAVMGWILIHVGRFTEAIDIIEKGMRLDPQNPGYYLYLLGHAKTSMGQYEHAVKLIERAMSLNKAAPADCGGPVLQLLTHS